MQKQSLQIYLHEHIPLSASMGVEVLHADGQSVILQAPLEPNINHRDTVFGGSAVTLAILSAWSLLHVRLLDRPHKLVIRHSEMQYSKPMDGTFQAHCVFEPSPLWERFEKQLRRHRPARINVNARLMCRNKLCGVFNGEFVALP